MDVLNEVLGHSAAPEPPARDIDGVMVQVRVRRVPNMHALTQRGIKRAKRLTRHAFRLPSSRY